MKPQEHNSPLTHPENSNSVRETQEDAKFSRSQAMKSRWQNPEFRASALDALSRPEVRSKASKRKWQNPEFRAKVLAALRNPENRSKSAMGHWQNPEFRVSVLAKLHSPESRTKAAKTRWQNPEFREQSLAKLHSPEVKEITAIARAKRFKEDPDIQKRANKTKRDRYLVQLKQLLGGDPKPILEDLYFTRGLSAFDIADRYQKGPNVVYKWFKILGIKTDPHKPRKKTGQLQNIIKKTRREANKLLKETIST